MATPLCLLRFLRFPRLCRSEPNLNNNNTEYDHNNPVVLNADAQLHSRPTRCLCLSDIVADAIHVTGDDCSTNPVIMAQVHNYFMGEAIRQAQSAAERGEVPVGALVVRNYTATNLTIAKRTDIEGSMTTNLDHRHQGQVFFEVLSSASNRVEMDWDASAHAELLALRQAARVTSNWRLYNSTLYTTLEPCPMCLAAAQAFRVDCLVMGAPDLRLGAVTTHMNLLRIAPHPFHNISHVVSGIRQEECAVILRDFFRRRRSRGRRPHPQFPPQPEGMIDQQLYLRQPQAPSKTTADL